MLTSRSNQAAVVAFVATAAFAHLVGCGPADQPESSYFDERIQPILSTSCVRQNTGCHLGTPDGISAGNLDLTSYDAAMRRDDLFEAYGPYPLPLLLLKPGDSVQVPVETLDGTVQISTDIRHAGGSTVDLGTSGFALLQQWTTSGHLRTGVTDETLHESIGPCRSVPGEHPDFDPSIATGATFERFRSEVNPVLQRTCAGASCHGNPIADLYLACGDDDAQLQWNYWVALQFVTQPASISELLRRPLSTLRGGTFHEGGNVFGSTEDPDYQILRGWAEQVATDAPAQLEPWIPASADEDGYRFFVNRVQPILVREGCMFLNCHSPVMFHDLRLRGGSGGHFGRIATARNYELARLMLALESSDPNESRIIAKNLYPHEQVAGGHGIAHRGGSLFEDFGNDGSGPNLADPSDCAGVDADAGDLNEVSPYCVLARWHQIEHEGAIARGEVVPEGATGLVWVVRPDGIGATDDFDTYRPGADLVRADVIVAADGSTTLGPETSLLGGCGLTPASADVRTPAVSWSGDRIAFAARTSADTPLRLYWMAEDGSGCEAVPGVATGMDEANGILIHDFDPAFSMDDRLVFASTRGNLDAGATGRTGPTRAPASMRPNANLYILEDGSVRQLTYLLNQDLQPALMVDGRLMLTSEKRELDFHQMAGRRMNLDGADYHPNFAQRDSIGFASATEMVESFDRNFVMVASELDHADGAGTIVIMNRSLGPDQHDREPGDRSYLASTRVPAPGAMDGGTGVFRSPAPLPSGRLLASCDLGATSPTAGPFAFEICEIDPDSGATRVIGGRAGASDVELVAIVPRAAREVFRSRPDEPNGNTFIQAGATDAEIIVNDFPVLATLLFANTRTSIVSGVRPLDPRIDGFDVLESLAPPDGATSFADLGAEVVTDSRGMFYRSLRPLGHVDQHADGSARFRIRGGAPIVLRPTDASGQALTFGEGDPFAGEVIQREQMQFYPGERAHQSMPRAFFNPLCGGCHGTLSGRELDSAIDVDILTEASRHVQAGYDDAVDLTGP